MLWLIGIYIAASVVAAVLFAWDKRAAHAGRRRVPEKTLHLVEACGGWPGALAAMRMLRHKSSKPRYYLVTWLIASVHAAAWMGWWITD